MVQAFDYVFYLKKTLLYLYEDELISTRLIDGLYDFIRSQGNITYFTFNDNEKSMILKIDSNNLSTSDLLLLIKNWFGHFVVGILNDPSSQYILSKDSYYNTYIKIIDNGSIYAMAQMCITTLDISVSNTELILKINLID